MKYKENLCPSLLSKRGNFVFHIHILLIAISFLLSKFFFIVVNNLFISHI
nr:MAG TPA: hypothetical protein [Crassvirales sp.]